METYDATAPSSTTQKKVRKIRWADSSGNVLAVAHEKKDSTAASPTENMSQDPRVSRWSDRKKKDLFHEKEMLFQARYVSFDNNRNILCILVL